MSSGLISAIIIISSSNREIAMALDGMLGPVADLDLGYSHGLCTVRQYSTTFPWLVFFSIGQLKESMSRMCT